MNCGNERVARYDFTLRRGDSAAMIMRFRTLSETGETQLLDLSESTITLSINWPGGGLARSSTDSSLEVDAIGGTVTWRPGPQETLGIPDGRIATYRILRQLQGGEQRTLVTGFITGVGFIGEGGESDNV